MLSRLLATHWGKWVLFLLMWVGLSLLFVPEAVLSFYMRGQCLDFEETLQLMVLNSAIALALVPGIVWLTRRVPVERRNWHMALLAHVPACVLFSLSHSALYWAASQACFGVGNSLFNRFHPNLLTYWAVVGFTQAVDYFCKYQAREQQVSQLRLELLKAQLHPHFLFNTLHTISAMMHEDVKGADRMIRRLSELLRLTLENIGKNVVTLGEELEFVRLYLEIQRERFGERLATRVEASDDIRAALVPALFLQPLVENCVKHGLSGQPDGEIVIRATREAGRLVLSVSDNGCGLARTPLREGVGLSNTRHRLQQLYPGNHSFSVRGKTGLGAEVVADIPFQTPSGKEHEDPNRHRGRRALGPHEASVAPQLRT
jgi:two-component system LytT family sensor kinase